MKKLKNTSKIFNFFKKMRVTFGVLGAKPLARGGLCTQSACLANLQKLARHNETLKQLRKKAVFSIKKAVFYQND